MTKYNLQIRSSAKNNKFHSVSSDLMPNSSKPCSVNVTNSASRVVFPGNAMSVRVFPSRVELMLLSFSFCRGCLRFVCLLKEDIFWKHCPHSQQRNVELVLKLWACLKCLTSFSKLLCLVLHTKHNIFIEVLVRMKFILTLNKWTKYVPLRI